MRRDYAPAAERRSRRSARHGTNCKREQLGVSQRDPDAHRPSRKRADDVVWATLDDEQQTRVLGMLARPIARVIAARTSVNMAADVEASHE